MTDKQGVSPDVRIAELAGQHAVLQSEVKGSIQNMASTLASVQAEVRTVVERVTDVAALRAANEQDRAAMARIESTLTDLGAKIERRLERMDRENEDRWLRHEAENENTARDMRNRLDNAEVTLRTRLDIAEHKISRAVGWTSGLGVTAMLLIGGFIWAINFRFEDVRDDTRKIDPMLDKIHALELYLARGGSRPTHPYQPPTPEKNDER